MKDKLSFAGRIALHLVFVPKCIGCGLRMSPDTEAVLCPVCRAAYESEKENTCFVCGGRMCDCLCLPKQLEGHGIKRMAKLYDYEPQKKEIGARLIYALKHKNLHSLCDFLGKELAQALRPVLGDGECVVTYPPRGKKGILRDGFDHAEALSRAVAKNLSLSHLCTLRRTHQAVQKSLTREARLKAASLAYALREGVDLRGKRVILCDDVCTSGATLIAAARHLRRAGAKEVIVATLALTPEKNSR